MTADLSTPKSGMRRSQKVALVLLGTAGVVGVAAIWDGWNRRTETQSAVPAPAPVSVDREYANNEYVPGVGYYHAPYHAWFPQPYNYYDPNHGYFAGGLWQAVPWMLALSRSQPTGAAVASALAAQKAQEAQQAQQRGRTSGFSSGGYYGSHFGSPGSGSGTAPSSSHPSIMRGGFGSSGHPAGS